MLKVHWIRPEGHGEPGAVQPTVGVQLMLAHARRLDLSEAACQLAHARRLDFSEAACQPYR